ncbi:MAG TPA: TRAP transporter large permease subunit, partial [Pseudolabrys sp.]|nr:TRAP transporter large permease subunit [Pseudolabrys sp.]
HMFVMYNGILSMITPPVAFAAYAAANIARTDGWNTGWIACVVGWSTFLLPFLFVLTPSLLMDGSWTEIALNLSRVTFGIWLGTTAAVGFALSRLNVTGRVIYGVISLAVVLPPEAFPGAIYINAAGLTAAAVMLGIDWTRLRALRKSEAPA